jgi:hypothetical protein
MDAQLAAPLAEAHPELAVEQPAQRALAGPDLMAELSEGGRAGRIAQQQSGHGPQPRVAGHRQVQRLLGGEDQLVDRHRPQPGHGLLGPGVFGQDQQGIPGQRGDRQDGRVRG